MLDIAKYRDYACNWILYITMLVHKYIQLTTYTTEQWVLIKQL